MITTASHGGEGAAGAGGGREAGAAAAGGVSRALPGGTSAA